MTLFDIKLACYTGPFGDSGFIDAISLIGNYEFDGIECQPQIVSIYEDRLHVLQEIIKNQGLCISSLMQPLDLLDKENADMQIERAASAARFISAAGAKLLTVCHDALHEGNMTDAEWATAGAILEEAGDRCAEHGIVLCYLPRAGRLISNVNDIKRLMASTKSKLVKLALDTAEAVLAKTTPQRLIKVFDSRVQLVRFRDVSSSKRRRKSTSDEPGSTPQFGRGAVNFDAVSKQLIASGYKGWITLDVSGETHAPKEAVELGYRYIMRHSGLFTI